MGIMDLFKKKTSGNVAKDRLKLVLVSDRANCSSEMMEMMKNDIIEVISRYMDIDAEALDVKITETESDMIRTMFRSESRRRTSALAPGARVPMVCSNPILFAGL